ncbi:TfuA-like protein [Streptomyces sp. WAC06614]|uniref:TfuA-like protein n=1 Tax=Streptomyces sp. WAC06614 TaxID=2487416 RepID=UPI000F76E563|nr:TfuA domain-containing protein [Streptomyces sp. WAC06614]RSS83677.1 hypothetical protein EF918_03025 [Streptomyces sp. WAC06614]
MRLPPRTVVTSGPTLSPGTVRRYLPYAEVRGPVAADQVLRWGLRENDRLLVVDGLFLQSRAVRHKELLALLDDGVQVLGASSMGALRAAELHPFGMQGIGSVFRAYRDQEIVGDDEVALLHADADAGHRPLSWALVDLRHALGRARRQGVLDEDTADLVLRTAADLPFTARDDFTVLARAREQGAAPAALARFRAYCRSRRPSIKRRDALSALRLLSLTGPPTTSRSGPLPGTRPSRLTYHGVPVALAETVFLRSWRRTPAGAAHDDPAREGNHERCGAEEAVSALALTWNGYPSFFRDLAAEQLLAASGHDRPLSGPGSPSSSPSSGRGPWAGAPWPVLSRALYDRLEHLGMPSSPRAAEPHLGLLRPRERALPWQEAGPLLATRLWRSSSLLDWVTPAVVHLADHPAFHRAHAEVSGIRARADRSPRGTEQEVRGACRRLFADWHVEQGEDLVPALRERGFLDLPELVRVVRHHHALLVASDPDDPALRPAPVHRGGHIGHPLGTVRGAA